MLKGFDIVFPCYILLMWHCKYVVICSCSSPIFKQCFVNNFIFNLVTSLTKAWSTYFPIQVPWHGSSHPRQHWSDLFEMNGLITGSERRWNTVWCRDEWNWELGLKKPLREIEGINDCSTARGPNWPTFFFMALWLNNGFSAALSRDWLSRNSAVAWLTWCSFPHFSVKATA